MPASDVPAVVMALRNNHLGGVRTPTAARSRRARMIRQLLLAADVVGLFVAFVGIEAAYGAGAVFGQRLGRETLLFAASLPLWLVLARIYGLYRRDEERAEHTTADDLGALIHLVTIGSFGVFGASWFFAGTSPRFSVFVTFWVLAMIWVVVARAVARAASARLHVSQNAIIVGAGDVGQLVARKFLQHPEYGINLVGFMDAAPRDRQHDLERLSLVDATLDNLPEIVREHDIERVIIAFSHDSDAQILDVVRAVKDLDVQVDIVPRLFEVLGPTAEFHMVEGLPLIAVRPLRLSRSSLFVKRSMDLALSIPALILLSPVMAYIALRIKLSSPGPVFYRHDRLGRHGRPFRLFKFRTMHLEFCRGVEYGGDDAEEKFRDLMSDPALRDQFEHSYKLQHDPRVTKFGAFLRRSSLDELPQLINVALGHISLVGPRPITEDELSRYGRSASALLDVRPGVTGYWQINGRSNVTYEERVRLDMAYVGWWSVRLDLNIIAKTFRVLISDRGAY